MIIDPNRNIEDQYSAYQQHPGGVRVSEVNEYLVLPRNLGVSPYATFTHHLYKYVPCIYCITDGNYSPQPVEGERLKLYYNSVAKEKYIIQKRANVNINLGQ